MSKEPVFTMKLERELIGDSVQRQRQARDYDQYLPGKVADAREQVRAGDFSGAIDVEARFAARRAKLLADAGNGGA